MNCFLFVTGRSNTPLFQLRQRSKLRYQISSKSLKDKYEVVLYSANDGIRMDFIKQTDKKTSVISLNEEQFSTLRFIRLALNNAVRKRQDFNYDLGDNIKVSHEKYRKVYYIALRLWYVDDKGDLQPSLHGVNLPHEVWKYYIKDGAADDIGMYK